VGEGIDEGVQDRLCHPSGLEHRLAEAQRDVLAQDEFQRPRRMQHGRGQPNCVAANLQNRESHRQGQSRQARMRSPTTAISPSP